MDAIKVDNFAHFLKSKVIVKIGITLCMVLFVNINAFALLKVKFDLITTLANIIIFGLLSIILVEILRMLKITIYLEKDQLLKILVLVIAMLYISYILNQQYVLILNIVLTLITYDYLM